MASEEIPANVREQLKAAYRRMAYVYRPMAPSDGFGNITVPASELDLNGESEQYARWWWWQEREAVFEIGGCNHMYRPAMVHAVAAAQFMCTGDGKDAALKLLRMAIEELEKVPE